MITEIADSLMSSGLSEANNDENDTAKSDIGSVSLRDDNPPKEIMEYFTLFENKISLKDLDKTVALIRALQPYLSSRRSHSADTVIKFLSLLKGVSGENLSKIMSMLGLLSK